MLLSIHAATRGLISNNLPLGIATDGLIRIKVGRPGPSFFCKTVDVVEREFKLIKIREDDEEILEILMAIMPTL